MRKINAKLSINNLLLFAGDLPHQDHLNYVGLVRPVVLIGGSEFEDRKSP